MDIEATYTVKMNWRGTEAQYVAFAEMLSRRYGFGGLDTLDSGDATGFFSMHFLAEAHKEQNATPFETDELISGLTLTSEIDPHLFKYSGEWGK